MRALVCLIAMTLSFAAGASQCVDSNGKDITAEPEVFQALIAKKASCYEAKELAEACAWGSGLDVSTAEAAYGVCSTELVKAKPSKANKTLLASMKNACTSKYKNQAGSMYRSMNAYCHLTSIGFIVNLATPN